MLLLIEALLLMLAALQDYTTAVDKQIYPLDMAENSVDDQYDGCIKEAAHNMMNYLEKERKGLLELNKNWQEGEKYAAKPESGLTEYHMIALYVYTNKDSDVYSTFNRATRSDRQNYPRRRFQWYSLHFLLTEAIQILRKANDDSLLTYRGTSLQFAAQVGNEVRLGSFSSSSLDKNVALKFGNKTCFEIHTCKGAHIQKYSKYPDEKEVLIPPYETFKVVSVKKIETQIDLWCKTVITLESLRTISFLNCAAIEKGRL